MSSPTNRRSPTGLPLASNRFTAIVSMCTRRWTVERLLALVMRTSVGSNMVCWISAGSRPRLRSPSKTWRSGSRRTPSPLPSSMTRRALAPEPSKEMSR